MKRSTHVILGMGVAGLVASLYGCGVLCWLFSVAGGGLVNIVVDVFGHEKRFWRSPRRTRASHSLPGIVFFSLASSAPFAVLLEGAQPLVVAAATVAAGLSHWLTDLLTPAGVYMVRRRVRIPLARYDNPAANLIVAGIGVVLLAYSLSRLLAVAGF